MALDNRPDLRAAVQAVAKARTDYQLAIANGSTDPTIGWDIARDPPMPAFYRLQHRRSRCGFSIETRAKKSGRGSTSGVMNGSWMPPRRKYSATSIPHMSRYRVILPCYTPINPISGRSGTRRETISFSYQHGEASLLDFLQAQQDYRSIQLGYLNLVGAYLTAAAQMSLAVGREVIL